MYIIKITRVTLCTADSSGLAVHGCLSFVSAVCCLVESLQRADPSSRGELPTAVCNFV